MLLPGTLLAGSIVGAFYLIAHNCTAGRGCLVVELIGVDFRPDGSLAHRICSGGDPFNWRRSGLGRFRRNIRRHDPIRRYRAAEGNGESVGTRTSVLPPRARHERIRAVPGRRVPQLGHRARNHELGDEPITGSGLILTVTDAGLRQGRSTPRTKTATMTAARLIFEHLW